MYKKILFLLIHLSSLYNSILSQSKKEIIQYLEFKIDSLNTAFNDHSQKQNLLIKSLEDQVVILKSNNYNLKLLNNMVRDSLNLLISEKKAKTYYDIDFSVNSHFSTEEIKKTENSFHDSNGFDYSRYYNKIFNINSTAIIEKEKHRILNSKYAIRDNNNLYFNIKNNKIFLKNDTFHFGVEQKFYSFLFEDLENEKVYCAEIDLGYAGGGSERFSLIQVDLKSGKIYSCQEDSGVNFNAFQGGDFYFNSDNSFVVAGGWNCSIGWPLPCYNNLTIVNLNKRKIELKIVDSEVMNFEWLSKTSFKCQVIKYTKTMEPEPYFNHPTNDFTPFTLFSYVDGKWIYKEL